MRTFDRSRALLERARRSLAGGVSSPVRGTAPVPLYFTRGAGPRLQDADGHWYIDYAAAWGPVILGYSHPAARRRRAPRRGAPVHLRRPARAGDLGGRADPGGRALRGARRVQLERQRGRPARASPGPRLHAPDPHPEVRGPLPRLDRRRAGELPPARGARPPRDAERHPGLLRPGPERRRERARRALERPRDPRRPVPDASGPDRGGDDGARALQQRLPHAGAGLSRGRPGPLPPARSALHHGRGDHGLPDRPRRGAGAFRRHARSLHLRQGGGGRRAAVGRGRTPGDHGAAPRRGRRLRRHLQRQPPVARDRRRDAGGARP